MGDKPLWALLIGFLGWELWASQVEHDIHEHTLSWNIWKWQRQHPGTRVAVGAFLGGLAAHLLILPKKA